MNFFFVNSWENLVVFLAVSFIRSLLKETGTSECAAMHTFIYRYDLFIISFKGSCNIQTVFQLHFHSKHFFPTTSLWMTSQMRKGISKSDRECHSQSNCIAPFSSMDHNTDQKSGNFVEKAFKISFVVV